MIPWSPVQPIKTRRKKKQKNDNDSEKQTTYVVYYNYQQRSLRKTTIGPKFVELTADVLANFFFTKINK